MKKVLFIVALLPIVAHAQTTSSTQAILSYTAGNTNECTVEVSTSPSYSPLVNAVDSAKFTDANLDGQTNVGSRSFLVGQRTVALALDSKYYSLALENSTTYYYRLGGAGNTCSASPATGTFTTMNIPRGITYGEPQAVVSAGRFAYPTVSDTDRTATYIDPTYGTLVVNGVLPGDDPTHNLYGPDAGNEWAWSKFKIQDGSGNNIQLFNVQADGGFGDLYGILDSTGEVRFYGLEIWHSTSCGSNIAFGSGVTFLLGPSSPPAIYSTCVDGSNFSHVSVCTLPASGNSYWNSSVSPSTYIESACTVSEPSASSLATLIHDFNASYDTTKFTGGGVDEVQESGGHTYLLIHSLRGVQDTYGWTAVFDVNTGTIVAAQQNWTNPLTRWCVFHTTHQMDQTAAGWFSYTQKGIYGGSGTGSGPYTVALSGSMDGSTTPLTITVSNPGGGVSAPSPTSPVADTTLMEMAVGDVLYWPNGELDTIASIGSNTSITVNRTAMHAQTDGTEPRMGCGAATINFESYAYPIFWNYLQNPSGTALANNTSRYLYAEAEGSPTGPGMSGHQSYGLNSEITEGGWIYCPSYTPGSSNPGPTYCGTTPPTILDSPSFSSFVRGCSGDACQKHPTAARQALAAAGEQVWGMDSMIEQSDVGMIPTSISSISGSLYQFSNTNFSFSLNAQSKAGLLAAAGTKGLLNISGPGSTLGNGAGDNYKVCIARNADECVAGSTSGNVYFNIPGTPTTCQVTTVAYTDAVNMCISTQQPFANVAMQIGYKSAPSSGTETTGIYLRSLTQGLMPWHLWNTNANVHQSQDGKWFLFPYQNPDTGKFRPMIAKVPAWPATDGIDRTSFGNVSVTIGAGSGGATHATVTFGYEENELTRGTTWPPTMNFYCTQYQGQCYYESGNFSNTVAADATSLSLNSVQTLAVGIPQRVLFYQVQYRDAGNAVVATDPMAMTVSDFSAPAPPGGGVTLSGVRITGAVVVQ